MKRNKAFFRQTNARPISTRVKRFIRLKDTAPCIVVLYKVWGSTGYGSLDTKVIHRWPPKSVLRRAGVR